MESNIGQGTEKLYYSDAYQSRFTARVLSCEAIKEGFALVLDRTAFFPEEGGQSADTGRILPADSCQTSKPASDREKSDDAGCGLPVTDVRISGGTIRHTISEPLPEGTEVIGEIDWIRRFSNMQQHSAEHLFSGVVHARFGYENVGFHLSDREVTMDYSGPLRAEEIASCEAAVNAAIWENIKSRQLFPEREELAHLSYRSKKEIEGQVRLIEYPGIDLCACCAPHVKRTGEIGLMKVVSYQNYKGGTRIFMLAGDRALRLLADEHRLLSEVSRGFSTAYPNVPDRVAELKQENISLKRALAEAAAWRLTAEMEKLDPEAKHICLFTEGNDERAMRKAVNTLSERHPGIVGIFDGNDVSGYRYILGSSTSVEPVQNALREMLGAKGGGSPKMARGAIRAKRSAIEALFSQFL